MGNPSQNSIPLIVSYSMALAGHNSSKRLSEKKLAENWLEKRSAGKRRKGEKETNTPHLCESLKGLLGGFRSIKTMMEVRVIITTAKLSKKNAPRTSRLSSATGESRKTPAMQASEPDEPGEGYLTLRMLEQT